MADERRNRTGQSPQTGTVPADAEADAEGMSSEGAGLSREGTVPSDLAEQLAAAEAKADEHLEDLRRLAAEFDNYRKRVARDHERLAARANERLMKELLPIVDDLERALDAAEHHEEARLEEGVKLVHRSLADVLRREGLEEITTDGRFDPHVHEALLAQPSEAAEGSVIQVLQKGYRLGDLVLRPARVVVSAGEQGADDGDGE